MYCGACAGAPLFSTRQRNPDVHGSGDTPHAEHPGDDGEAGQKAIDWITSIVAEPEVGTVYDGKVVKLMDFGAFVNFLGSKDGLVHISELSQERVGEVGDVVSLGDEVKVKVIGLDRG